MRIQTPKPHPVPAGRWKAEGGSIRNTPGEALSDVTGGNDVIVGLEEGVDEYVYLMRRMGRVVVRRT